MWCPLCLWRGRPVLRLRGWDLLQAAQGNAGQTRLNGVCNLSSRPSWRAPAAPGNSRIHQAQAWVRRPALAGTSPSSFFRSRTGRHFKRWQQACELSERGGSPARPPTARAASLVSGCHPNRGDYVDSRHSGWGHQVSRVGRRWRARALGPASGNGLAPCRRSRSGDSGDNVQCGKGQGWQHVADAVRPGVAKPCSANAGDWL